MTRRTARAAGLLLVVGLLIGRPALARIELLHVVPDILTCGDEVELGVEGTVWNPCKVLDTIELIDVGDGFKFEISFVWDESSDPTCQPGLSDMYIQRETVGPLAEGRWRFWAVELLDGVEVDEWIHPLIDVAGPPSEPGEQLRVRKVPGTPELAVTWRRIADRGAVFWEAIPDGPFADELGSGTDGWTRPPPGGRLVFFQVVNRNSCGDGP